MSVDTEKGKPLTHGGPRSVLYTNIHSNPPIFFIAKILAYRAHLYLKPSALHAIRWFRIWSTLFRPSTP